MSDTTAAVDLCRAALWPELTEAVPFDDAHERQARSAAP
jgi:hypothetical protein